ncbi:hypothetical protein LSAT2_029307 [Lamellibrachia satsuma]|nr:hypothetical protein LSAT2_029307 [Lamellibrachia satsuma]
MVAMLRHRQSSPNVFDLGSIQEAGHHILSLHANAIHVSVLLNAMDDKQRLWCGTLGLGLNVNTGRIATSTFLQRERSLAGDDSPDGGIRHHVIPFGQSSRDSPNPLSTSRWRGVRS